MTTALNPIAIGTTPGDGTGDIPRAGFTKVKSDHAHFLSAIGYRATNPGTFGVSSSAGSTTVLNDATNSWNTSANGGLGQFAGQTLTLLTGANAGDSQTIQSNTSNSITVSTAFGAVIASGVGYQISPTVVNAGSDGFANLAGSTNPGSIIDGNQSWTANQWTDFGVTLLAGPYAGQTFGIKSNIGNTLVLRTNLSTAIAAGTPYVIGALPLTGNFNSVVSAALSANQNDYAPTGWGPSVNKLKLNPSAGVQITGLSATGFADGARVLLENRDTTITNNITLLHASSSSASANQFLLPGGASYSLVPFQKALLVYDLATTSWGILS